MTDQHQIVEEIQRLFSATGDQDPERIGQAHAAYVEAVADVNRRLRQCEELLHNGHRSEAIQLCEGEPNLLDLVTILDFPECDSWVDYAGQFGHGTPPNLMIDVASELNEAYSAELPLAELLRRHRISALARLPLAPRIAILRRITRRDQDNPIWKTDLRAFEKARHAELRKEAAVAERDGAIDVLAELDREVSDPDWLQPPPRAIVKMVADAFRKLRMQQARVELQEMEPELAVAFTAGNVEQGREIRERWRGLANDAEIELERFSDTVTEFLDWLEEYDREDRGVADVQLAVERLERAIDRKVSVEELQRLSRDVPSTHYELPLHLANRLSESRLVVSRRAGRRRGVLVLLTTVVLIVAVGVWNFVDDRQQLDSSVTASATELGGLITTRRFSDADEFLQTLEQTAPRVFRSAPVRRMTRELERARAVELQRQTALEDTLETARRNGLNVGTWDALTTSIQKLDEAETTLCRDEGERNTVAELRRQLDGLLLTIRQRSDKQAGEFLVDFRKRFDMVQLDAPHDLGQLRPLLEKARPIEALPGVAEKIRERVDEVVSRLEGSISAAVLFGEMATMRQKITKSVGDRKMFRNAIEAFAQRFAVATDAVAMKQVAATESSLWWAFERWDSLIARELNKQDLTSLGRDDAKALIAQLTAQVENHGEYPDPDGSNITDLLRNLESTTHRVDDEGRSIADELKVPLTTPLVANLMMLRTKPPAERRYYSNRKPELIGGRWRIEAFTDLTVMDRRPKQFKPVEIANPRTGLLFNWEAPQSRFSDLALEKLDELADGASWDAVFTGLLVQLTNDTAMEPFLKLQLMNRVLKVARQGSAPLSVAFAKHDELLQSDLLDKPVNWMDADDLDAQNARKHAERLAKRLPRIDEVVAQTLREAEKLKRFSGRRFDWIGWLHRSPEDPDQWHCSIQPRKQPSTDETVELYVLVGPSGEQSAGFQRIGKVDSGELSLRVSRPELFVAGRPIFRLWSKPTP